MGDKRFCNECEKESAESKHRMHCSQEPRFTAAEEIEREDQWAEQEATRAAQPKCGLCTQGVPVVVCSNHPFKEHIIDLKPGTRRGNLCHHKKWKTCGCNPEMKRIAVICIDDELFKRVRN